MYIRSFIVFLFCLELELERYKFVVQVVIGELRGEGVKYDTSNMSNMHNDGISFITEWAVGVSGILTQTTTHRTTS